MNTQILEGSHRVLLGLLLLACAYTLYFAAELLIPLTVSLLLALMLTPLVRTLRGAWVPRPLAAAAVVAIVLTGLGAVGNLLWEPAAEWVRDAPENLRELEPRLRELREPLDQIRNASAGIAEAADGDDAGGAAMAVELKGTSVLETAAAESPRMIASFLGIIFLLYFLLAYGDQVLKKIERLGQRRSDYRITEIFVTVQHQVSRYLLIITLVNLAVAAAVGVALWLIGFPHPFLWGAAAGLLNFAPYVGAAVTAVLLTVVGLLSLDSISTALIVPAVFMVITALEGQLLTPTLLGRHLAISPYMVFLSITFWGWLWGIVGALIAVPLLVIVKIVADSVPSLDWLATLLDRDGDFDAIEPPPPEPRDANAGI